MPATYCGVRDPLVRMLACLVETAGSPTQPCFSPKLVMKFIGKSRQGASGPFVLPTHLAAYWRIDQTTTAGGISVGGAPGA